MTHQLMIASGIEILLMVSTFILLSSGGIKALYHWAGTVLLCLTFCWSVILGCVIAIHQITFQL